MPKPKIYTGFQPFAVTEPHAGMIRKWAAESRRSLAEQMRIIVEFYDKNAEAPHPNGAHETCN